MPTAIKKIPVKNSFPTGRLKMDAARRKFLARHQGAGSQRSCQATRRARRRENSRRHERGSAPGRSGRRDRQERDAKKTWRSGLRAKANALYASGNNRAAVEHHEKAFELYESLKIGKEAARTLSSSIQPLILLGNTIGLFRLRNVRERFSSVSGETRRIASLDNNVGNIFHRQDRFEEAMPHYERAYKTLSQYEDWERVAIALHNMAMCLISLNDFPRSLDCYQKSRELCNRYGMPLLRDQADYNIAYLYYFRGEYSRAIEMLFATRRACEISGDAYHLALCHLDLSEIYLELNLSEEAREMAREGFLRFEKLGMGYEAAKTLANEAIAYGQQGKTVQALERFTKAREMFAPRKISSGPGSSICIRACFSSMKAATSKRAGCAPELPVFRSIGASRQSGSCTPSAGTYRVTGWRTPLRTAGNGRRHRQNFRSASPGSRLPNPFPSRPARAMPAAIAPLPSPYQEARKSLEALRSRLHAEELKISFVKNRLQVYEALVDLHLSGDGGEASAAEAFSCIEAAKSRSMTEMIFQSGQSLPLGDAGQSELVRRIRDLREELNWYYHRIELEQLRPEETSAKRLQQLQEKALSHENELLRTLRELPAHERENATLEAPADFSLEKLQSALPADAALIEYYSTGDRLVAALVTRNSIDITPITVFSRVIHFLHLLRFQLSKFRMGSSYTQRFDEPLLQATQSHLEALYVELIAPLRPHLQAKHLIFVPHGPLHFLPFHALKIGDSYLCDAHTVSYAPSATVFALCQEKRHPSHGASLVMGIPDDRAPHILPEVQSVAAILPKSFSPRRPSHRRRSQKKGVAKRPSPHRHPWHLPPGQPHVLRNPSRRWLS